VHEPLVVAAQDARLYERHRRRAECGLPAR